MISINYMKKKSLKILAENNDLLTMAISNCLFSPILKIRSKFSAWCVFVKFNTKLRNYSRAETFQINLFAFN